MPPGFSSPIWIPSGIAVATVLFWNPWCNAGVFIGSFLLNLNLATSGLSIQSSDLIIATSIAFSSTLQSYIASLLIRKAIPTFPNLKSQKNVLKFYFYSGPVTCLIAASISQIILITFKKVLPNEALLSWLVWYIGDTIGVLTVLPLVLIFFSQNFSESFAKKSTLATPLLISSLLSLIIFINVNYKENEKLKTDFNLQNEEFAKAIALTLNTYKFDLIALEAFFDSATSVDEGQFKTFTQKFLTSHPGTYALSWLPAIKNNNLNRFISLNRSKNKSFNVFEKNSEGLKVDVKKREIHYPVLFIEPKDKNISAIGFDIGSNEERLRTINQAIETKNSKVTPPIKLVQTDNNSILGILVINPFFKKGLNRKLNYTNEYKLEENELLGLLNGVFLLDELIIAAIKDYKVPLDDMGFIIDDITDSKAIPIYTKSYKNSDSERRILEKETILNISNRLWRVRSEKYLKQELFNANNQSFTLFIICSLFTIFVGILTLVLGLRKTFLEKDLKSATQNLSNHQTAIDASSIVVETDLKGNILYANDKFLEISKFSREELIGQNQRIVNSGFHSKDFFKNLWGTINRGDVWKGEIKNKAKDGSFYWVETTINPIFDENKKLNGFIAIRFDITEKKEMLLKLESAMQAAIHADKAKSEFLYTMSHEIRTPLNGIIGLTSLLQDTILNQDQQMYLNSISQSGKSLLSIINDILDFSKIEAGKMELEEVEFDLKSFFSELLKSFQYTAEQKGLTLNYESQDYSNYLKGDSGKIGQIITNLVSNAIKFTKHGSITVSVYFNDLIDKTKVTFLVKDTGIGIPIEAQTRMFQAFSQAEKSTSRTYGGTGLGLSISKRLVEMMSGNISFVSKPNEGTTFKVELELIKGNILQPKLTIENNNKLNEFEKITGRVLIAEDNLVNQIVISRILDKWNCKHQVVGNGKEVLEILRKGPFDLILMDCQMPEMDGYQATQAIRNSNEKYNRIPIVALTANAVQGDQQKCFDFGMNDYLTKPVDREALKVVLLKYLTIDKSNSPVSKSIIEKSTLFQLEELNNNGQDAVISFIDTFLTTTINKIDELNKCNEKKDAKGAASVAHNLKASAQVLGAVTLEIHCQTVESLITSVEFELLSKSVKDLNKVYFETCNELKVIKNQRLESISKMASGA